MRYFAGFGEGERNLHSIYSSYLIKLLLTISLENHSRFLSFLTSRIEEPLLMYQFHLLHIFDIIIMVRFLQGFLHLINNLTQSLSVETLRREFRNFLLIFSKKNKRNILKTIRTPRL